MAIDRRYRCRACGRVFNAWLPAAQRPNGALLLNHLADRHRAEARPYLRRMETEDIDAVVVEAYERIEDPSRGVDKN
jgi:hypothetical protein